MNYVFTNQHRDMRTHPPTSLWHLTCLRVYKTQHNSYGGHYTNKLDWELTLHGATRRLSQFDVEPPTWNMNTIRQFTKVVVSGHHQDNRKANVRRGCNQANWNPLSICGQHKQVPVEQLRARFRDETQALEPGSHRRSLCHTDCV